MAQDENVNFCGDKLRLSAFLRIVAQLPQPPSRCRRGAPNVSEDGHVAQAQPPPVSSATLGTGETITIGESGKQVAQEIQEEIIIQQEPDEDQEETITQEPTQEVTQENLDFPFKRKDPVVYNSKTTKTDARRPLPSHTRKRRPPPVNELALVQTTAEDGFPDRSCGDVDFAPPVTEIDPIEESQLPRNTAGSGVHSPHVSILSMNARWKVKKGPLNPSSGKIRSTLPPNLADGFDETELHVPIKAKVKKVMKRRKRPPPKILRTGLALTTGALPEPGLLPETRQEGPQLASTLELAPPTNSTATYQTHTATHQPSTPSRHIPPVTRHIPSATHPTPTPTHQTPTAPPQTIHPTNPATSNSQLPRIRDIHGSIQHRSHSPVDQYRIESQLSLITAPSREDTDTEEDTDPDTDMTNDDHGSNEDRSSMGSANGDQEYWSQYNAMD